MTAFGYDSQADVSALSGYAAGASSPNSTVCIVHDALGRLTLVGLAQSVSGPGATACQKESDVQQVLARFRYDHANRRVARQDAAGHWTLFASLGSNPLAELAPSGTTTAAVREYLWLNDTPLAQVEHGVVGAPYFIQADFLGAPHALTSMAGATVWRANVLPYGEMIESTTSDPATSQTVVTNLRLPGQYDERLLGSLGLQGPYYNWNRWYLPGVGRYLEPDPIALAGGFNTKVGVDWYGYGMQNPLRYSDPWGLMSCTYNVREHSLRCTTDTGTPRFQYDGFRSGNDVIPGCRDNPSCDPISNIGPLPPGLYRIDNMHWDFRREVFRRNLIRIAGQPAESNHRDAFQIHYCKNLDATHCSDGCVTSNEDTFWRLNNLLNEDDDNYLIVDTGDP